MIKVNQSEKLFWYVLSKRKIQGITNKQTTHKQNVATKMRLPYPEDFSIWLESNEFEPSKKMASYNIASNVKNGSESESEKV